MLVDELLSLLLVDALNLSSHLSQLYLALAHTLGSFLSLLEFLLQLLLLINVLLHLLLRKRHLSLDLVLLRKCDQLDVAIALTLVVRS